MTIDLDAVSAIDVHVHVEASVNSSPADRVHPVLGIPLPTVPELADLYRALGMAAVVFPVDAPHSLGHPVGNEEVAAEAAKAADVPMPPSRPAASSKTTASAGSSSTPPPRASSPTTPSPTRSTQSWSAWACPPCSTPDRSAAEPGRA